MFPICLFPGRIGFGLLRGPGMLIKIHQDANVCRYLFTAKSLYMFRHPSSRVLKIVTATSGIGHTVKKKD